MALNTPTFILDACSLINLFNIDDEDNFIIDLLLSHQFIISEAVFSEVNVNIKSSSKEKKEIDIFLSILRGKVYKNSELENDIGKAFISDIFHFCDYNKRNGEFYSTLLSLIKCRLKETFVVFVTDDFPAIGKFSTFFEYQQIGNIINTCDLLTFLYWKTQCFSKRQFVNFLSSLRSEYRKDINDLLNLIRSFKINNKQVNIKKEIRILLDRLENNLRNNKYNTIHDDIESLKKDKKTKSQANKMEKKSFLNHSSGLKENTLYKTDLKLSQLRKYEIYTVV